MQNSGWIHRNKILTQSIIQRNTKPINSAPSVGLHISHTRTVLLCILRTTADWAKEKKYKKLIWMLFIFFFFPSPSSLEILKMEGRCRGNTFILQTSCHHTELQVLFLVLPCTKQRWNPRHEEASCQDVNPLLLSWFSHVALYPNFSHLQVSTFPQC